MDTELFQIITLALLVANLIALLLALSVLNRVKDSFAGRAAGDATAQATELRSQPVVVAEPGEQQWGGTAAQGTAAAADHGSPWPAATAGAATRESSEIGSLAASEAATPSTETASGGRYETTPAGAAAATGSATTSSGGAMPEEQPFERDGRWWFKRGDELLVYDEGTGQWTPAPATGGVPGDQTPATALSQVSATAPVPEAEAEAGFWKCPSCGAVNGSTADSCRMCFTSRP